MARRSSRKDLDVNIKPCGGEANTQPPSYDTVSIREAKAAARSVKSKDPTAGVMQKPHGVCNLHGMVARIPKEAQASGARGVTHGSLAEAARGRIVCKQTCVADRPAYTPLSRGRVCSSGVKARSATDSMWAMQAKTSEVITIARQKAKSDAKIPQPG